jgi:hypothetical protein
MVFSKRMGGYNHTRLPGSAGAAPLAILTDGLEDETEEINGMGSGDTTHVCNSDIILKGYKDWVKGYLG